ncbi:36821_t:CDS:2, partial [Racocetra persica]
KSGPAMAHGGFSNVFNSMLSVAHVDTLYEVVLIHATKTHAYLKSTRANLYIFL